MAEIQAQPDGGGLAVWKRFQRTVASSGPLTKGIAGAIVVGFVLQLALGDLFRKQFALVPAKVIPKFWMVVSASLVELNFLQLLVNLAALFFVGSLLEPLWGAKEMVKFLVIINGLSFACVMVTYIFVYIFAGLVTILYAQLGGFTASIAGLLVGLKQALPEEELHVGSLRLRFKNLPLLYLGLSLVLTGVFENGSFLLMALYGTLSGWFYIRKYQQRPESGAMGDQSDSFRLVTLFPEAVHPTIEGFATQMFSKRTGAGGSSAPRGSGGSGQNKGTSKAENPEATRRRERGAKALEERLEKIATTGGGKNEKQDLEQG
jgi:membrane associated rhomboid family serine protease